MATTRLALVRPMGPEEIRHARKRITLTSDEAIDLLRLIDHHAQLAIEESRRLPDRGAKAGLGGCRLIRYLIAEYLGPAITAEPELPR